MLKLIFMLCFVPCQFISFVVPLDSSLRLASFLLLVLFHLFPVLQAKKYNHVFFVCLLIRKQLS